MEVTEHLGPDAFRELFEYENFLSIFKYYIDLNCFVVPTSLGAFWVAVNYHQRQASLFDFELKRKYIHDWSRLTDPDYEKSRGPGEALLVENLGFFDAFMPIRRDGQRLGTLLSGAFADREITFPHLQASWKDLTGQPAAPENPEFRHFVRVMLETPVLEGPVLPAYRETLELFAGILVHGNHPEASRRLKELSVGVFSKHFPHSYWMNWALGLPTRQSTPAWGPRVQEMPWVREEIGITRIPTTVLTVIPLRQAGRKGGALEETVRVHRFQRRGFQFARTIPETTGGALENYGMVFISSPDPRKGRLQRRHQILETAERIRAYASEELDGPVLVGIGETVEPGEPLNRSFRQAVLALHLERKSGKDLVFYAPTPRGKKEGVLELARLLQELKRPFETASFSGTSTLLDEYLRQVLTLSFQDPEEIRLHLQYGLLQLRDAVKGKIHPGTEDLESLLEGLVRSLVNAGTTQEMVLAFKESVEKLMNLIQGSGSLREAASIEKVRDFLDERFRGSVPLSVLAKNSGISVSTLSRRFKKAFGIGIETYLQNLRLGEARQLLKGGNLPVSKIAQSCGFRSVSYFTQFFRKKTGSTPQTYRKQTKHQ